MEEESEAALHINDDDRDAGFLTESDAITDDYVDCSDSREK